MPTGKTLGVRFKNIRYGDAGKYEKTVMHRFERGFVSYNIKRIELDTFKQSIGPKRRQLMSESQNIEYKESWRDEYLKWVCGFANAQGGTIYIGVDDNGKVVGVKDIKKLLEDIPNKIQSGLGIVADVNKHTKDGKDY